MLAKANVWVIWETGELYNSTPTHMHAYIQVYVICMGSLVYMLVLGVN